MTSGTVCYYQLVQRVPCSSLLYENIKIKIYSTIILPVVLYGCENLSVTLREEHRLRVLENSVLRKIFGCKWRCIEVRPKELHEKNVTTAKKWLERSK
jgi:hypothetical protein